VAFYASVSFGKDSLAMLLLLLEKKMPLSVFAAVLGTVEGIAVPDSHAHEAFQPQGRSLWQRV
jgi:hypothetical protein